MEHKDKEKQWYEWFLKHWIISIFLILIFFGMISSIFSPQDNSDSTKEVINEQDNQQEEVENKIYTPKTIENLCDGFGGTSRFTDAQKDEEWQENYAGKYMELSGTVINLDNRLNTLYPRLFFEMNIDCGTAKISMEHDQYDKLILLNKGDKVLVRGKFSSLSQPTVKLFGGISIRLDEGELIESLKN